MCSAGTDRHVTAVAVPNNKYPYRARLLPYVKQLLADLACIHTTQKDNPIVTAIDDLRAI